VALPPEDRIVRVTEAVITEAAQRGHVVMVGRGAQAYLAEREGALHVYIVAPRERRIAAVVHRLGVTPEEAAKRLDEVDGGRQRYVRTHYAREWDAVANYDLVVSTSHFTYEQAAALIVAAAQARGLNRTTHTG
jgi:cytidylate kinase